MHGEEQVADLWADKEGSHPRHAWAFAGLWHPPVACDIAVGRLTCSVSGRAPLAFLDSQSVFVCGRGEWFQDSKNVLEEKVNFFLMCCGWSQRVKVIECQAVSLENTKILGWVSDCSLRIYLVEAER